MFIPVPVEPTFVGLAQSLGRIEAHVTHNQADIRNVGRRAFTSAMAPVTSVGGLLMAWAFRQSK